MAQEIIVRLKDDLDGTEATVTIPFAFEGRTYEIDLSDKNAAAFRKAVGKYVEAARRTSSKSTARTSGSGTTRARSRELAAIREWGRAAGFEVPAKGRIPEPVTEAYAKAH